MKFTQTPMPGVVVIELAAFGDDRGFFMTTFDEDKFKAAGLPIEWKQHGMSRSAKGTVRGLHFQEPRPQGKIVRAMRGRVLDVAVDIRKESPNFGKFFSIELSEENRLSLYIPVGYAHGFCVLSESADLSYLMTDVWVPSAEGRILWNDPKIGIPWPVDPNDVTLSPKDAVALPLAQTALLPAYRG